jgi:hypothetical protein
VPSSQELGDRRGEVYALWGLGEVDRMRGHYEAAQHQFEQSHTICQEIGDRHGEAHALWGLGKAAEDMADTDTAADHWRKALQILDALQVPFSGTVRDSPHRARLRDRSRIERLPRLIAHDHPECQQDRAAHPQELRRSAARDCSRSAESYRSVGSENK